MAKPKRRRGRQPQKSLDDRLKAALKEAKLLKLAYGKIQDREAALADTLREISSDLEGRMEYRISTDDLNSAAENLDAEGVDYDDVLALLNN